MNRENGYEDFIGTVFLTPKGGVLTVSKADKNSKGRTVFTCRCSVCSEDKDLWPYESIKATKSDLLRGRIPCGCAKNVKWSEQQFKLRAIRECSKREYEFLGWADEFKGSANTKITLRNLKTGNTWSTTTLATFLIGNGRDPLEVSAAVQRRNRQPDNLHIKEFLKTGSFKEGTIFTRNTKRRDHKGGYSFWEVTCPSCSHDEYVKNNLCSGTFTSTLGSLKRGYVPCRCHPLYKWTQEQKEYQIQKVCAKEGLIFIKWVGDRYKNSDSKFEWRCKAGHKCETSAASFLKGARCLHCYKRLQKQRGRGFGYFPERKEEQDFLYVLIFDEQYLKVGRSFDIKRRIKELKRFSKTQNIRIISLYSGSHQEVYNTEQYLHRHLTLKGFYHYDSTWSIETFTLDCKNLLNKKLETSKLKRKDSVNI